MLELIRTKAASWVARILALFLIASFAVWGIGDVVRGPTASADVAEVGDLTISARELRAEFRLTLNNLRRQLGSGLDTDTARRMGLLDQSLDGLVRDRLLNLEAEWLGLDAGDDLVVEAIHREPAFQNSARQFDPVRFRDWLDQSSMSEAAFVDQTRKRIMHRQIIGAVSAGSMAPKILAETLYLFESEKRSADFVIVPLPPAAEIRDPDPATLAEFHNKYAARFTAPEFRRLTVVHLSPAAMAAEIRPTEDRLRTEYEDRLSAISVPERRELQQILVQDEALARRVFEALKRGRDFTSVATEIAKLPLKALSLGWLRRTELPVSLADAAFALTEGGVGAPVRSPLGWHILRVVKIEKGSTPSFRDMREKIRKEVARDMAADALVGLANKLEDALAAGDNIEAAGAGVNARILRIAKVDSAGRDETGKPVKDIPGGNEFLEISFQTPMGEVSSLVDTADGGYFLVRVDGVTPPTLRPLTTVRNRVVRAWKAVRRDAEAKKKAEQIKRRADDRSLAEAAKFHGLKLQTSPMVARAGADGKALLPANAIPTLFGLKPGARAVAAAGERYVVVELKKIGKADPASNPERMEELTRQVTAEMESELAGMFTIDLRNRFPVTINRRALDSVF